MVQSGRTGRRTLAALRRALIVKAWQRQGGTFRRAVRTVDVFLRRGERGR